MIYSNKLIDGRIFTVYALLTNLFSIEFIGRVEKMFSEGLIPFGLEKSSNKFVDVGNVERGRGCDCICPSCSTPLLARQGAIKEWHFAHDSQKKKSSTETKCDYSFAVSVRLMIRQLALEGVVVKLPSFNAITSEYHKESERSIEILYEITRPSCVRLENVNAGVTFSGIKVDLMGVVRKQPLAIYIVYKGRATPNELYEPSNEKCGIIQLDVKPLVKLFKEEREGRYTDVLRKFLAEDIDGKSWVYHPRQKRAEEYAKKHVGYYANNQQKQMSSDSVPSTNITIDKPVLVMSNKEKYWQCVICKSTWLSNSHFCDKCKTHLFSREIG